MKRTLRACYICGETDNPIIASEPVERRFGKPFMPEGVYDFARCKRCSTLYVDSDVTDEYLSSIYQEETSESACEAVGDEAAYQASLAGRLPEFARHWAIMRSVREPRPGDNLLDVGCQMGDFAAIAQRDGVKPHGVELSRRYAELCRERFGDESAVHFGPVNEAPFEHGRFQYLTFFETLEHVCDPIGTLRTARPMLADDGVLAISVPSSDYFHFKFWLMRKSPFAAVARAAMRRRSKVYSRQLLPHSHIYNFSHKSIRRMLERAGFQVSYLGLTGWHGRFRHVFNGAGHMLEVASGGRIGLAPSLFAVARPLPEPAEKVAETASTAAREVPVQAHH